MHQRSKHRANGNAPRTGDTIPYRQASDLLVVAVLLIVLVGPIASSPIFGQTVINTRQEYNVKAVYLYSFGRYVTWPQMAFPKENSPFVITVFGTNPFGGALDRIAQVKKIDGRRIVIHYCESVNDYEPSQIVFVPRSTPPEDQAALIEKLGNKPVLLVGETPGFASEGGTMNFFIDNQSVRFELNVNVARAQRLSVSGKLLRLASIVGKRISVMEYSIFAADEQRRFAGERNLADWIETTEQPPAGREVRQCIF